MLMTNSTSRSGADISKQVVSPTDLKKQMLIKDRNAATQITHGSNFDLNHNSENIFSTLSQPQIPKNQSNMPMIAGSRALEMSGQNSFTAGQNQTEAHQNPAAGNNANFVKMNKGGLNNTGTTEGISRKEPFTVTINNTTTENPAAQIINESNSVKTIGVINSPDMSPSKVNDAD